MSRGTILSAHAHTRGELLDRPHRTHVVTRVGDDDGDLGAPYVWSLNEDGTPRIMYEENALAEQIRTGKCHIESPANLLGVLMFHWDAQERQDLAGALRMWCEVNQVEFTELAAPAD